MPIIKSAKKRVKTAKKKTEINKKWKDKLKTSIKNFEDLIEEGKVEEARVQLQKIKSVIDKSASKGIIHKNNAARKKSKLSKMLNKIA